MSNEPEKNKPMNIVTKQDPSAPPGQRAIAVAEIRFCTPNGRDVHLPDSTGGFTTIQAGQRGGHIVEIDYKPWIRHHHVRFLNAKRELVMEAMVHESWVSWTPAAEAGS